MATYEDVNSKIKKDIQTVGNDCFKLQVGPLEDTSIPAQLCDLVTSLSPFIQMASAVSQLMSTECNQMSSFQPTTPNNGTNITMSPEVKIKAELKEEEKGVITIKREKEDIFENNFLMGIAHTNILRT